MTVSASNPAWLDGAEVYVATPEDLVVVRLRARQIGAVVDAKASDQMRFTALASEVGRALLATGQRATLCVMATERGLEVTVPTQWTRVMSVLRLPEGLRARRSEDGVWLSVPGLTPRGAASKLTLPARSETLLAERQELLHAVDLLKDREAALNRARAELERSNADLERFAAAASHDLKEPLSVISLYTEIVREGLAQPSSGHEQLGTVLSAVHSMRKMLDGLLLWSRVERPCDVPPVRVDACVQRALGNLHGRIRTLDAVLDVQAPDLVAVAEVHLVEVVQNLVANSLKYRSQERPRIRIRSELQDGLVAVSVADNGKGIAPRDRNRVFELFAQSDPTAEGAGVGLALVARYAERYGGDVSVHSELGEGSTFTVRLPAPA